MDAVTLVWINTLALLGVAALTVYEVRKISEALGKVSEDLRHIEETASRGERLSLAILERLPSQPGPQA